MADTPSPSTTDDSEVEQEAAPASAEAGTETTLTPLPRVDASPEDNVASAPAPADPDERSLEVGPTGASLSEVDPAMGRWAGYFAAFLTGALYFVSFPGVDFWPAAFVAWVPWMMALQTATPARAARQGILVGMVCGVLGFYWLLEMLRVFSGFPEAICAIFMLIVCAFQAGLFALLGWLYARGRDRGWPVGLVFSGAFIAAETAYPLLFPFTFGASMHDVYPIVQLAEIGGPILVALSVLAPNWALALVFEHRRVTRKLGRKLGFIGAFEEVGPKRWVPLLLVPVVASVYGLVRIVQVDEAVHNAEKIRVGIVQANMSLMDKRNDVNEGLRRHTRLTRTLLQEEKIDLAVWPETSVAGAVPEDEAFAYYRKRVTGRLGVPAIVGAVLYRDVDDARETIYFNTALISDDRGQIQDRYDKQFLLLFGEYLPFGDKFPVLHEWSPNSGRFSPGTSFEPLRFHGKDIATFICYEDISPSFVNKLMKHGDPQLLVNMTNDAWFGDSSEPWEHMALAKLRAVEQRRFFVRSTNSGISGFVDPVGRLTKKTETFKEAAIAEDVAWLTLFSPFRLWGTTPYWLLSVMSFVFAFRRRGKSSPNR